MDFRSITRKFIIASLRVRLPVMHSTDESDIEWLVERISSWTRIRGIDGDRRKDEEGDDVHTGNKSFELQLFRDQYSSGHGAEIGNHMNIISFRIGSQKKHCTPTSDRSPDHSASGPTPPTRPPTPLHAPRADAP